MKKKGCKDSLSKGAKIEIAEIFRTYAQDFLENHSASPEQIGVLNQIITCRTAAQGGHIDRKSVV